MSSRPMARAEDLQTALIRTLRPLRRTAIDAVTTDFNNSLVDDLVRFVRDDVAAGADLEMDADTDLVMSGLVDSLGVVMIVEHLEQRLGIKIDPVDVVIEHFSTVSAILDYLNRRDDCTLLTAD